jgi:Icc-related predicted phosphoesterase
MPWENASYTLPFRSIGGCPESLTVSSILCEMCAETVSLCIISDTHRQHREITIPVCDILIHCGDFCSFRREDLQTLNDVDTWFSECPAKHILCVGGNHDFLLQTQEFRFTHAHVLQDQSVEICGLTFYGTPWCPKLSGFAYYATDNELLERWKRIPNGIDVLITHTPPYGILDLPTSGDINLGCPYLLEAVKRIRPRLHVFGHVHASHGVNKNQATHYINASIVGGHEFAVCHTPTNIKMNPRPNDP